MQTNEEKRSNVNMSLSFKIHKSSIHIFAYDQHDGGFILF